MTRDSILREGEGTSDKSRMTDEDDDATVATVAVLKGMHEPPTCESDEISVEAAEALLLKGVVARVAVSGPRITGGV
jgi:hypothetical protein